MPEQYGFSDVEIRGIWLKAPGQKQYDLKPHFRELNIYESVFSNSLTANITLSEAVNLPTKFPIVGEEMVVIDISIPGMTDGNDPQNIKQMNPLYMYVHKITNHKLIGPQAVEYSLELVSPQYKNNLHTRVSKSYSDMKANLIALDIWSNYLFPAMRKSNGVFQPTSRKESCVIPNWTPYRAINWLAKRSNPLKNSKAANYVFFESLSGSHFVSLDSLIQGEPVILFTREPNKNDPTHVKYFEMGAVVKCDSIHIVHEPEIIKNTTNGCYASKLITHDIVTKKIVQHDYDLNNSWNDTSHLSEYAPVNFVNLPLQRQENTSYAPPPLGKTPKINAFSLNDCTDSAIMFAPKHNQMYSNNAGHEYDNEVENWKAQRRSQLSLLDGTKFTIQAGAMPFLRVGMCADIHIMSPESYVKHDSFEDKKMSGKCLITSIRHIISQEAGNREYKVQIDLVKDGIG